jgi:thiosulfate dehydrogenase
VLVLLAACAPSGEAGLAGDDAGDAGSPAGRVAPRAPLRATDVAWPAAVPLADTLPDDAAGRRIRRGRAILAATRESLPSHVGNQLRCTSCHLDDGRRRDALPWVGVMARFPQYRTRNAKVNVITDRVNDCLERSLAGRALPHDDDAMRDIVAYFTFLSRGVPMGARLAGQGAPRLDAGDADTTRGAAVYAATCARCHGARGDGTALAPPLWGDGAYSIGAGMGRPLTAAAFIRANMPFDQPPGRPALDAQQARDVAAYINAQPRPDFARKHRDWPFGGAPADVPYATAGRAAPH